MPKKITGFSLDEGVAEAVRELADKEDRTLSNYINILLQKHLKAKGSKPLVEKKKLNRRKT